MCGRYAQGRAIPELIQRYLALGARSIAAQQSLLGAHIAPGTTPAVLYCDHAQTLLGPMRWGFIPHWTKDLQQLKQRPINARSETAATGAFFRDAFRARRCIVPATGFYEWSGPRGKRVPWHIRATDQTVCSFAGLWSPWAEPNGTLHLTFTILTTAANATIAPLHDRMPCILREADEAAWLDPATPTGDAQDLLAPYPAEATEVRPATPEDTPALFKPTALPAQTTLELFPDA